MPDEVKPAPARTAVALIAPPRLPYPEGAEERFAVDKSAWKALCESVFPAAKTAGAIILALSYCKARKLDPFKKPVHIVPIYDAQKREYVESVWPGIGEHRTTAFRTGTYAGMDETVFGPDVTETFKDKVRDGQSWKSIEATVTFPAWAQVTVYRMVQGQRVAFPGPRVYWREFYSRMGRSIIPNDRWQKAPYQMVEKCAEAGALRRGFPEELGEDWTAEEAGFFGATDARDVTPGGDRPVAPSKEPTRAEFRKQRATDAQEPPEPGDTDQHDQQSPATPADDASVGADAASHPATQPTEKSTPEPSVPPSEPAADYDPDPPWDAERCRTVGRAIIGDLMKAKTIKAVDNIIATRGVDLAEIKRASEQAYDHIMTQSAGRKEFLAASAA